MLNHWGPPKYPLPFQVYGLHNPEPNKDMLNPATFQNKPYLTGGPPHQRPGAKHSHNRGRKTRCAATFKPGQSVSIARYRALPLAER